VHPRVVQEIFGDADDSPDENVSDLGDTAATAGALISCRTFDGLALVEPGLVLATIFWETSRLCEKFGIGYLDKTYLELVAP
jgi:hypothetical protein